MKFKNNNWTLKKVVDIWWWSFSQVYLYMSQAFAEIRHFRKCQGIPEMPGFSSIAKAFAENLIYLTCSNSGKWHSISKKTTSKLIQANLT